MIEDQVMRLANEAGFSPFHQYQLSKVIREFALRIRKAQAEDDAYTCEKLGAEGCGTLYIAAVIRAQVNK